MGQTLAAWVTRARGFLGDSGAIQRITDNDLELGLQAAIAELGRDRPRETAETFVGDGATYDFTLSATAFILDHSRILEVEYPTGEREPQILDSQAWTVLRGTRTLRLFDNTPSASESIKATYTTSWPFPTAIAGDDLVPSVWFDAVAALGAAEAARALAGQMARRRSSQVAGELLRTDGVDDLFRLVSELRNVYRKVVLGQESGSAGASYGPALYVSDVDVSHDSIFHGGRR